MVKKVIRRIVPTKVWEGGRRYASARAHASAMDRNYAYDQARFAEHASADRAFETKEQLRSYITMLFHSLEKGLALPAPRPGFGQEKAGMLLGSVEDYAARYGEDPLVASAVHALEAYLAFNDEQEVDLASIRKRTAVLSDGPVRRRYADAGVGGGAREMTREQVQEAADVDFLRFLHHRFSIRTFADRPVADAAIHEAVAMAQRAPSVCNRQSGRVHAFRNDALGQAVLACQQGNRGFGHQAQRILVVTSELGSMLSIGERNQGWIDGGLFAMTLVYALHAQGLGTCCLNWSVEDEADLRLRSVAPIPDSENVIMLIAVGHLPERFRVAHSQRLPTDSVVSFHEA